jgi:hypothetical protein
VKQVGDVERAKKKGKGVKSGVGKENRQGKHPGKDVKR